MKKAQVTIFIILGILIIVLIIMFFILKGGLNNIIHKGNENNPNIFLENCIEDKVREGINLLLSQGGNINPQLKLRFKFTADKDFHNLSYLCYTKSNYFPCTNQEPMLINHLKDELSGYIKKDVKNCFNAFISSIKEQNYNINSNYKGFDIEFDSKNIIIKIYGKIFFEKLNESYKQENFNIKIPTRLYELAVIAQEISSQEAEFCNFETLGFMLLNHNVKIDKFRTSKSDTIYTLKHKKSKEVFRFAVRSCVIPSVL